MALKGLFFFQKIARIAQQLMALPPGPHTCHFVQSVIMFKMSKRLKCHPNGVKITVFFPKKFSRISQWLRALPPGPHNGNFFLVHNLHNQQLLKSLLQSF